MDYIAHTSKTSQETVTLIELLTKLFNKQRINIKSYNNGVAAQDA